MKQIDGQLDIFSLLNPADIPISKQLLNEGDRIWIVTLDVVESGLVERVFDCPSGHGYTIAKSDSYGVVWDANVNRDVFTSESDARRLAESVSPKLSVARSKDFNPYMQRSWSYSDSNMRLYKDRPYIIYATICMIDDKTVYLADWGLYHFLYKFKTPKEADEFYQESLKKILQRPLINELPDQLQLKDMYRCSDSLHSEWRYAERHGKVYKEK